MQKKISGDEEKCAECGDIKTPKASRERGLGRGVFLRSPLGVLREHRELPSHVRGEAPTPNAFSPLFERHRTF